MRHFQPPDLPDPLRAVEERLRRGRTEASPLELDRLKRRALAQSAAHQRGPSSLRSRLIGAATAVVLLAGAGGAVALSGLDRHPTTQGSAANHQYKHHKYCNHGTPPPGKKCKGVGPGKGRNGYGHKSHHSKKHHKGSGGHHPSHHRHTTRHKHHHATRHPRRRRGFTG